MACQNHTSEYKVWTKINTFAGMQREFGEPFGLAFDKSGNLFVSDGEKSSIFKISPDKQISLVTDKLDTPSQIAFDKDGYLFVADSGSHSIKKIDVTTGTIETIAGVEGTNGFKDGESKSALFNAPIGIAVSENKIFVSDTYNDKIRLIENGQVSTLAGSEKGFADGPGNLSKFDTPNGLAMWKDGRLLIADSGNKRLRVLEPNGKVWTLAGDDESDLKNGLLDEAQFVQPTAVEVDRFGAIFIADGNSIRAIGRRTLPMIESVSGEKRGYTDGNFLTSLFNRPSGLAIDKDGNLFVADSENQTIRVITGNEMGKEISIDELKNLRFSAEEFRKLQEPRWTYNPPEKARDVAGTLGEIRGEITAYGTKRAWFHNGFDIAGSYGETAYFIRDEKVLKPSAVENFETLRELIRMPTIGYIHIRLGRDQNSKVFDDRRFQFFTDDNNKLKGVRVSRGTRFKAGERIGTLNAFNHVHLIAGRTGAEMNALDALIFPNIEDTIPPTIENIEIFDENWNKIETDKSNSRIKLNGKMRVTVTAFDQMNGGAGYRKLGVYKVGYQILKDDQSVLQDTDWRIVFERMPDEDAVKYVYALGSQSGYKPQTVFKYVATNKVSGNGFSEDFFDAGQLNNGQYILRVFVADFFGNSASKDLNFTVTR